MADAPSHASEHLLRARVALLLDHPFIASATMRLPFRDATDRSWCETLATDGYAIYFNRDWIAGLTRPQLSAVIAHEVLHCVLGHVDRRGARDPMIWNMAADFAINGFLRQQGFELPGQPLLDHRLDSLTAEEIYDRLLALGRAARRSGRADAGKGAQAGFDLHLEPDDPRAADLRDADEPDAEERRQLRHGLAQELRERLHGSGRGEFNAGLDRAVSRQVDWRALLRRWLNDRVRSDWQTYPFSRRWIHRGLLMPSIGVQGPGRIVFAIDTSGSMTDALLAQAFGEVESLRRTFPCELDLVQCDAAIRDVRHFEAEDPAELPARLQVKGRGGTDFRPLFRWVAERAMHAGPTTAPLIFVSDGQGTYPDRVPEHPTIWLMPANGNRKAVKGWGEVVVLEDGQYATRQG